MWQCKGSGKKQKFSLPNRFDKIERFEYRFAFSVKGFTRNVESYMIMFR